MEDENNPTAGNPIPLALSILALVLAASGLYFGLNAKKAVNSVDALLATGSSSMLRLEQKIKRFEADLASQNLYISQLKENQEQLRLYQTQANQLAKQAVAGVQSNRAEFVKLVQQLNGPTEPAVTQEQQSVVTDASASAEQLGSNSNRAGRYTIQPGDNFAKIAASQRVSLQSLLDANSAVDPRRLQIGQEIQLPAN
jgi:LysM repeat protein